MTHEPTAPRETATGQHPPEDQLIAFGLGRCDDDRADEIERHVLECTSCCQRLAQIPDDALLEQLHGPAVNRDTNALLGETDVVTGRGLPAQEPFDIAAALESHPKYELIQRIGEGGMGVVYKVRHRIMDRPVALKVISPRMGFNQDARARFEREIQIVAKLNHPNIVAAFDAEMIAGHLCLVSEYFESDGLDAKITRPPISITTACRLVQQAAIGLQHAHQNGLIHRDIKPHNVLVSSSGHVKVVDFGLASYAESDHPDHQGLTSAGVIVGTPDYISPEQARESGVDHRADIYSLGCTLYHLICGRPPFDGASRVEKLSQHLQANPKKPSSFRHEVPSGLDACVMKMMAKDPTLRYQSAGEVASALEPYCSELPSVTPVPRGVVGPKHPGRGRFGSPRSLAIPAAIGAALLGVALLAFNRPASNPSESSEAPGGSDTVTSADPVYGSSFDPAAAIDPVWSERSLRLLAVAPPNALGRDRHNLYQALDELGLRYDIHWTSNETLPQGSPKLVSIEEVDPGEYDAVVFLGPDHYVETELTVGPTKQNVEQLIRSIEQHGQPLACFGTGIWTLGQIGALRGKSVANCNHSTAAFKNESGADWIDGESLVIDNGLISGTNTEDAKPFLKALMRMIQSG